jgi:hypothetical protein
MSNKYAAKYSIVRFSPFLETGEFANVGVVVVIPALGIIDFKLNTQRYGRVTGFFPELGANVYRETLKMLKSELLRVHNSFDGARGVGESQSAAALEVFAELTRDRETIIQFSAPRIVACTGADDALLRTYGYYVDRDFATKEYVETTIEKGLKQVLLKAQLAGRFHRNKVGDSKYEISFPFVEAGVERGPVKLIKPLNLAQDTPTQIIDHSDVWGAKLSRLVERKFAVPEKVLFVVAAPNKEVSSLRMEAYHESVERLGRLGKVVMRNDEGAVLKFARD